MISSDDLVVVSPDVGGVAWARVFPKKLSDAPSDIVDKRRQGPNISGGTKRKSISIPSPLKSRKSSTSSPVEMTSLPEEMNTAEVKSQKKRKRRKNEWGATSDGDVEWANSLSECQLDLMVSVKQLAMERVRSTRQKSLNGLLTPAGLRAIGIILEEFLMDRVLTLRNASTAPSLAIDDLRACIEKLEAETNETKDTNQE